MSSRKGSSLTSLDDLTPPIDDGLEIPEVGPWSRDKHDILFKYMNAVTTAMKHKNWTGIHYIDLFAGAGVERERVSRQLMWGSPLLAAKLDRPFDGIHCCEKNSSKADALCSRLAKERPSSSFEVRCKDGNACVDDIISALPKRALSIAFLDPYGLHLRFDTVRSLSNGRVDLVIYFPISVDAKRNWFKYYRETPDSNLDRFLGIEKQWLPRLEAAGPHSYSDVLRDVFYEQLKTLGYEHFDSKEVPQTGRSFYSLIFATKHKTGLDIWKRVHRVERGGQRTLGFD